VIGAKRLSEVARSRGTGMREFKRSFDINPRRATLPHRGTRATHTDA